MDFTVNAIGICASLDLDLLTNTNTNKLILEDKKSEKKGFNQTLSDRQGKKDFFFFLQYF